MPSRAAGLVAYGNEHSEGKVIYDYMQELQALYDYKAHDKLQGNTALAKTLFVVAIGLRLRVILVNGTLKANNSINNTGFLQNTGYIASIYPSNSSIHYRDVYQYSTITASFTGTMKFTLPKTWSNTMLTFTIKGYNLQLDKVRGNVLLVVTTILLVGITVPLK